MIAFGEEPDICERRSYFRPIRAERSFIQAKKSAVEDTAQSCLRRMR